jgi:hypothetical protein
MLWWEEAGIEGFAVCCGRGNRLKRGAEKARISVS